MRYNFLQKFTSFFLIFSLLFSITVHIPFFTFFGTASADEEKFYNVVSILVDEDIYNDVRSKLVRYSLDIQGVLENTRAVILPVPSDASPLDVASLNEKLYFEGYKGVKEGIDFESKLIGTVIIGNVPLPIVFDGSNASKTLLPYIDFIDKSYIFDHESGVYKKDDDAPTDLIPEIWHGVIAPNSGDESDDVDLIKAYFDKNHEYYLGTGNFQTDAGIINGDISEDNPDDYQPYVFYYDQFRETSAINYESYVGYQAYLQNLEDITYKRYSAELAQKVQDQVLGIQNENLRDLIEDAIPGFLASGGSLAPSGPDLQYTPDIQTRYVTDNATNKFLEILNSGTLSDIRTYVHNAGRYNTGGNGVNVDMIPFLVSILDAVSGQVVKNVNNALENEIDTVVQNGLSRNILIPVSFTTGGDISYGGGGGGGFGGSWGGECSALYNNVLYGINAADIENAADCSPYRGSLTNSGTLVEANRGYNISLSQNDINACAPYLTDNGSGNGTVSNKAQMVRGFWSGNSPLNLNTESLVGAQFELDTHDLTKAIIPIKDVIGSKEITNINSTPDPRQCFDNNFLLAVQNRTYTVRTGGRDGDTSVSCERYFQLPLSGQSPLRWNCGTDAVKYTGNTTGFQTIYDTLGGAGTCLITDLQIAGTSVGSKRVAPNCSGGGGEEQVCTCPAPTTRYNFKEITSYITHTSPTSEEFGKQVQALTSPNLPIDKDRYIDFIAANGTYSKINYPYLFRVSPADGEELNLENVDIALKNHLDDVSVQINAAITAGNPSSLSGPAKTIFDTYLSTGEYPSPNFNLYQILQSKELQTYTLDGEEKELSYYDTLVFAVYWNNLKTPSAKYKFIFENYLSDQFGGNDFHFLLPKNKKSYEVAYLGAPGDAQNMYIKFDPEEKGQNPYAGIIGQNITLNSYLGAANINPPKNGSDGTFKCAPPDGVPIWQWIPAIICRLQDMLPPKIGISEGSCGPSLLSEEEQEEINACQGDVNKNGVSDCLEGKLTDGSIELESDSDRYYYNKSGALRATLKDKNDIVVTLDSVSYVDFKLTKVEIPLDPLAEFDDTNTQTLFDISDPELSSNDARKLASQYVNYNDVRTRVVRGTAVSYFSTKLKDVNLYFSANLTARDPSGNSVIDLEAPEYQVQVRGDRLFLNSYSVEGPNPQDVYVGAGDIVVSEIPKVFIIDTNQKYVEDVSSSVFAENDAPEKILLALTNYSKNGNILPLAYPLSFLVRRDGQDVFEESNITRESLANYKTFPAFTESGKYDFIVKDASGFLTTKTLYYVPEVVSDMEVTLGTTVAETGGVITTHLLTLKDRFGNVTSGDIYSVRGEVSGGGIVFEEGQSTDLSFNTIEGYRAIRIRSTNKDANNTMTFRTFDGDGNELAQTSSNFRTVDGINIEVASTDTNIRVGGGEYSFDIVLKDGSGNIISDINSRAYMVLSPLYGTSKTSYVTIENGKGTAILQTGTVAARDVKLEFQVEGINGIKNTLITIFPDVPLKVDLSLSRSKIEASPEDSAILYAVLKDRYDNDVFNDSTTVLDLEVPDLYSPVIRPGALQKTVVNGKAQFELNGTEIPGIAYFKVGTTPSLATNNFELIGQAPFAKDRLTIPLMRDTSGLTERGKGFFTEYNSESYISRFSTKYQLETSEKYLALPESIRTSLSNFWDETNSLTVRGVGENAGKIETFYFWSKEEIEGNRYNGIYSVLLGAPYGDITQENYLGGSLLFDRDNRSLAVTSLLNTPYKYQDIASFTESGNLRNLASNSDITQDLEYRVDTTPEGILTIDITNAALGNYVGSAYYDIGNNVELSTCSGNFVNCFHNSKSSISAKTTDDRYTVEKTGGKLVFKNNFSQEVLRVDNQGRIIRNSSLYLELDRNNTSEYLKLFVMNGEDVVGEIALNITRGNINITREQNLISQKLSVLENTILVYLKSNQYGTRDIHSQDGKSQKVLYYNDPFADSYSLDIFHETEPSGIENFVTEKGLGWEQENKMMLAFAAGESVGESIRDNFSFSLVNLGDPVVNLKVERKKFTGTNLDKSFDASLGEVISNDPSVVAYQTFDYNNDNKTDIILAKTDGYIELLENKDIHENYLGKGNLVYAVDGGPARLVKAGDFTGDGYDDIFFVSDRGEPVLFNNVEKNFTRYSLSDNFTLSGAIIQAEVFDMDDDGKTDIVTLDDSGLIHIFYGGGASQEPLFTKLKVGDGYGIKLSESTTNYGGAVYFDGVDEVSPNGDYVDLITSMEEYNAEMEAALAQGDETEAAVFGQYLVERLLFVPLPYVPYAYDGTPEEQLLEALDESIPDTNYDDLNAELSTASGALAGFMQNYSGYINYDSLSASNPRNTYFLRSEYADTMDLEITKTFVDTTPEFLQTGDIVNVELSFKNTGTKTLNNIAYVDNIPRNFTLPERKFEVVGDDTRDIPMKPGLGLYDFLIDGFFLTPGEEVTISYALKTLPLKYGYMQVGLFEKGELGDDPYGDIILKPNELNCGEEADIYTSVAVRSYTKGKTTPSCNADSLELPEALAANTIDNNNNGVPDYIDDLVGGAPEDIQDYSKQVFEDLYPDVDGDGIPNDEDDMPEYNQESGDFMAAIGEINGAIDQISDQVDEIIQGFGCGFGGGSCITTPLNWAPLAPGGDPTLFGYPIGDGLKVNEGIPIFSALTGINIPTPGGCYQVPAVYPVSPIMFTGVCNGTPGAGGMLGVTSPSNYVRLFATPTLTGGFGIAACFGAPAIAAGYANPPGVHPIVPGGNCIVAAVPLFGCSGEEGDPSVTGYPWEYGNFGVINANCPDGYTKDDTGKPKEIDEAFIEEFLQYKLSGVVTDSLLDKFKTAFSQVAKGGGNYGSIPSGPLININGGSDTDMALTVDFDTSALSSGNFQDVVKINNTRISPFPDFLMDWVTRQIEEVVNKLTNLPKVFVILPDFSGIFDYGWEDFGENFKKSFDTQKQENTKEESKYSSQIESLRSQLKTLSCSGVDKIRCTQIDGRIQALQFQKNVSQPEALSGIRAAYEFLGNVPLVNVETETINISIPWVDQSSIERAIMDWKGQALSWKSEIQRAANAWSIGATCDMTDPAAKAACEEQNAINQNAYIDAQKFVQSLERNIEILESYKDFPEQLNKLITIKETRLEQILCNIEAISNLLGGWLSKNGERFKAWVELFVLIKGILKSWQLLIDVFKGYDEECHQCKNERHDLQNFIFRLISAVIPKLPIIQFPKWPDIILDLHNVRAGLNLYLPDFGINLRPIVLPNLPELKLPDVPTVGFSLPELPILPEIKLPELPDLPSLPTIELPDLPPPPKIPKLFGAVEGILNIMKLVTKIMCIMKQSPFVPEWRAGDQIAFITERNGYMPMDFIDISLPQFSFPFVDAIKVTTYVNLEFEMEFIVEAVRQIVEPINSFSNNIANMIDIQVPDFDFSDSVPTNIDIDLELNGDVDVNGIDLSSMNMKTEGLVWLASVFAKQIHRGHSYIEENAQETIGSKEFIAFVQSQLANPTLAGDPKLENLRNLWDVIASMKYSKEDKLIQALQDNKDAKFETLTEILSTEIEKTKQLKEDIKNLGAPSYNIPILGETEDVGQVYNEQLRGHNLELVKSAYNLMNAENDTSNSDIVTSGNDLLAEVQTGIQDYSDKLIAAETDPTPIGAGGNACTYGESDYEYRYKGLYVLEYDRHYRLFEYLDELRGDERTEAIDIDDDGDEDLFYFMNNTLYLKENYKNTPTKEYISTPPLILNARDNEFFNGEIYYEAVNGFEEADINDSFINISFKKPTNLSLHNFRVEFFTIVDKFLNLDNTSYNPTGIKKFVVDAFENIDDITLLSQTDTYTTRKHLAYLTDASVIPGVTLTDKKLLNIREDIEANSLVQIGARKEIYAGKNNVSFRYYDGTQEEEQTFVLQKNTSVAFERAIQINSITGNAYIASEIHEDISGAALVQHIGLPIFPDAKITYNGNDASLTASSHLDIRYYDDSEVNLHFRDVYEYRLYDLGNTDDRHLIRLTVDNDFYYAKMYAFKDNLPSTYTHQILLSPQKEADQYPPEIGLRNKIRIPVYQQRTIDLTPYIYEDSGIANISEVKIDFDLNTDSDGDGFANNDTDTDKIQILRTPTTIKIAFGPYDELFTRKIRVSLVDGNGNEGYKDVDFEVYTPDPQIQNYEEGILYGEIDETLLDEPVRIYRVRGGTIKKLQESDGNDLVNTDDGGSYEFGVSETSDGLIVKRDGLDIARVNEYTGVITLLNPAAYIEVLPANDSDNETGLPRMSVKLGEVEFFYQYLQTASVPDIQLLQDSFTLNEGEGIGVNLIDQERFGLYKVPFGVAYNPGAVIVYDNTDGDKNELFSVFRDGRIYVSSDRWKILYKAFGESAGYQIVDTTTDTVVMEVVVKLEASYILR